MGDMYLYMAASIIPLVTYGFLLWHIIDIKEEQREIRKRLDGDRIKEVGTTR